MATQVFISWSGDLSKKLAEAVREWLPATLQFVKPYFTPVDIEKGTKWGAEISAELEKSDTGIICLTRENLSSPWILFEAGALSKKPRSRVCTLLFNLETTDVTGPLTLFQHTRFVKNDFKGLVETINNVGGESKLEKSVFDRVFEMWWPRLEEQIATILREQTPAETGEPRKERDILEELLELTRSHVQREQSRDRSLRERYVRTLEDLLAKQLIQVSSADDAFRTYLRDMALTRLAAAHSSSGEAASLSFGAPPEQGPSPDSPKEG